jgi:hypothetical protein
VGEAAELSLDGVEMATDLVEARPKVRRQPADGALQDQMHGGQELAGLVVEFMGNPAALGFLGLQELAGEVLQPPLPGLHCGIELGIGEGGGGVGGKEPHQRQGLGIEGPTRGVPEAERADHLAVAQQWQGQHSTHRGELETSSDGS